MDQAPSVALMSGNKSASREMMVGMQVTMSKERTAVYLAYTSSHVRYFQIRVGWTGYASHFISLILESRPDEGMGWNLCFTKLQDKEWLQHFKADAHVLRLRWWETALE